MPAMSGPSITSSGRLLFCRASSVSASMKSTMPFTSACERRSSTGALPPRFLFDRRFLRGFDAFGEIDQPFGRVVAPVEQHIFHARPQLRLDLFVNGELTGVHDRHVESGRMA